MSMGDPKVSWRMGAKVRAVPLKDVSVEVRKRGFNLPVTTEGSLQPQGGVWAVDIIIFIFQFAKNILELSRVQFRNDFIKCITI